MLGTAASTRNSAVSNIVPSFNPGIQRHIGKGVNPKVEYCGTALYGLLEVNFPCTSFICCFARILIRLFLRSCLTLLFSHCHMHIPVICEAAGKLFSPECAQAQAALCYKLLRRTCHRSWNLSSYVSQATCATAAPLLGEILARGERIISLTI